MLPYVNALSYITLNRKVHFVRYNRTYNRVASFRFSELAEIRNYHRNPRKPDSLQLKLIRGNSRSDIRTEGTTENPQENYKKGERNAGMCRDNVTCTRPTEAAFALRYASLHVFQKRKI